MHGKIQVDVVPRPIEVGDSLPFVPGITTSRLCEKAAFEPIVIGAPGYLVCSLSGELEHELVQITHPGQRSKCSNASLNLVLKTKINTASVFTPTICKRA